MTEHECKCKQPTNIMDLGLHERSLPFLTWIMRMMDGVQTPFDQVFFVPVREKFGNAEARWATAFFGENNACLEYWIIYKDDEATAVAQRVTANGKIECGFYHLIMLPVSKEGVVDLIKKLPKVHVCCKTQQH